MLNFLELSTWRMHTQTPSVWWLLKHAVTTQPSTDLSASDVGALVAELKQCSQRKDLKLGRLVHSNAIASGLDVNKYVSNTLITMYSRCGSMVEARETFRYVHQPDVVTWNALIHGYVENGESLAALEMFACMDCPRTSVTFVGAFKAYAALASDSSLEKKALLEKGQSVHAEARSHGASQDVFVGSSLINMYSRLGDVSLARQAFDQITQRNVFSWNALIMGYVENGESYLALEMFNRMNCQPDAVTIVAALRACSKLPREHEKVTCLVKLSRIHRLAGLNGMTKDISVANTLIDVYCKCGKMILAREVFNGMTNRNVVSWTALALGYVENGSCSLGLELLDSMDCPADNVTFLAAAKACAGTVAENKLPRESLLRRGVEIHHQARQLGFDRDIVVATSLVDMYSKLAEMKLSRQVFDGMVERNVVSWNSLILGYVENGESSLALEVFSCMDCQPDKLTFVSAIKACAALATDSESKTTALRRGLDIHKQAEELGLQEDMMVANTLIDMYSKCSAMRLAVDVFKKMVHRDVVSWTSLILGYTENGESQLAMEAFHSMDCEPNTVTFVAVLKACSSLGALETGRSVHDRVCELGLEQDGRVANCLVDFYGKCGETEAAEDVFRRMKSRDIVSWNALIGGYSLRGDAPEVFRLVKRMQEDGMQPDTVTVSLVLTVCSHAGMVDGGKVFFRSILRPTVEHYNCLVDLLGRANRLEEAVSVIEEMDLKADAVTWKTLLSSCRKWSNAEVGKIAFDALVAVGDSDDVVFGSGLLRDIYRSVR